MKQRLLGAAFAVSLLLGSGCANQPAGGGNTASGSIAATRDDALLYAADGDLNQVFMVNTRTNEVRGIAVGKQPEKVLVAPDETIYVTNRMDRSVSVLKRGETTETARIAVAVEPVGLAISSDSKTLYVVNAASLNDPSFGTLMAIDTATRQPKWEVAVGNEPRGITLVNRTAVITLYKAGDVVTVDLDKGSVIRSGSDVFSQLNRTLLTQNSGGPTQFPTTNIGGPSTSHPRGFEAITTSADGSQVFVASLLSSDAVLQTSSTTTGPGTTVPGSSQGGYGSSASCGATSVAAAALLTFDSNGNALVEDSTSCPGSVSSDHPPTILSTGVFGTALQGPRAMVADPTGTFVYVAHFNTNNVAIVPTTTRANLNGQGFGGAPIPVDGNGSGPASVTQVVPVGNGPTGIAVSHDGLKAWVFNAFDHSISQLEAVKDQSGASTVINKATIHVADDVLPADVVAGRKLFFSATDSRMNDPAMGIACGTCHLEGREDGHVWNFVDGPRQTPSLAGRMLSKTAPYHWNGEFNDLMSFMSLTVQHRMGGTGVTEQMEQQIAAFLDAQPAPDNAAKDRTPADVMARGKAAFDKANCAQCHVGETLTNQTFADVGTLVLANAPVLDDVSLLPKGALNTPSLLGVGRTGPYLHDGSAISLKARIVNGKADNKHGNTAQLSDAEVDDLVSYLKTL
jgi:DNA-binding beta-propeller fold protein YncE/mono/diheme cytochrome c family protein